MSNIRKCFLYCLQQSHEPINLPHNKPIVLGRNLLSGIKDTALARNQLQLIANVELCTVELIPFGINPSGVNGFVINRNKQYTVRHKDILELLLNKYFYEIIFIPEPEQNNIEQSKTTNNKRKVNDDSESHITKQLKCDITTSKNVPGWEEIDNKKLYIYTSNHVTSKEKVAAYDLDGTIITTKSGARFPTNSEDWKFAFPEVPTKILELHKKGFKVVIFTNQAGIGLGKVKINDFRTKIEKIVTHINIPVQVFVSTGKGIYRKPAPGMWDALNEQKNNNISIDLMQSFYCGDAAGREKNWAPKMKKDHSIADRLFALNIGLHFQTPEEHFLGARRIGGIMPQFDPRHLKPMALLIPTNSQLTTNHQEVIIFVGSPGSGKSYICMKHLVPQGYIHINRDNLGSWQKCVSALDIAMQKKQSVVIDNTNPDKESRKRFVDVAKKFNIPCRCFIMSTSIFQAKHNNVFREIIDKKHQIVTDIIINSYKNKFQEPSLDEGFNEIVKVNCSPTFINPEHERLYHMFLIDK